MKTFPRSWYARPTIQVAQDLIGKLLVRTADGIRMSGIITETEAYCVDDPACHGFRGMTERNKALFGPVGHAYVYFTYGMHFCMNVVAREPSMLAGGILIRALKPIDGIEMMTQNRGGQPLKNLTNGPGKVAQALRISRPDLHTDLTIEGSLYITEGIEVDPTTIKATPRIGISAGKELLWRFTI